MRFRGAMIAGMLLLTAIDVSARAQPSVRPSRDVVVTYRVDGQVTGLVPGGIPGQVRLSWDAGLQRVRAEAEGRTQVALIDLRSHAGQAVDTGLRVALPLKVRAADLQLLTLEGARLSPAGSETIAGLRCTTYALESPQGPGRVCLTSDGVPLRGQGTIQGRPGSFTAQSVRYGALPPSLFEVPPGYMSLAVPNGQAAALSGLVGKLGGSGGLGNLLGQVGR